MAAASQELLKPLRPLLQKASFLVDEIDKLMVALHLAQNSTYELKAVHLIDPVLDILRQNDERVKICPPSVLCTNIYVIDSV